MRRNSSHINHSYRPSGRGGARSGAGRPRTQHRRRVPHRTRKRFASARPLHVTVCVLPKLRSLRKRKKYKVLYDVFCKTRRPGFRICHYSVQDDHIHLIVEARNRAAMTAGMRSVNIRIGKGLNKARGRKKGRVLGDRYHEEHLGSPRQVRNTLAYVLNNLRRHVYKQGRQCAPDFLDPCSSAEWFAGWKRHGDPIPIGPDDPIEPPRTLLLKTLWRRRGLIEVDQIPRRVT